MKTSDMSLGMAHEFVVTTVKAGWEISMYDRLAKDVSLCERFRDVLLGRSEIKPVEHIIDCTAPVFFPGDWEVLPDAEQIPNRVFGRVKFEPSKVVLHLSVGQKGGKQMEGNNLRTELEKERVYTAHVLDYLLKPENQYIIPEEWKKKAVFFWGTIYNRTVGGPCVRFLCWYHGEWRWDYTWLSLCLSDHSPAAVAAG